MAPPEQQASADDSAHHPPRDSLSSVSTTSIVFDRIKEETEKADTERERRRTRSSTRDRHRDRRREDVFAQDPLRSPQDADEAAIDDDDDAAAETGAFLGSTGARIHQKPMHRSLRTVLLAIGAVFVAGWVLALFVFISTGSYKHASDSEHDPDATIRGSGKPVTIDQVLRGEWSAKKRSLMWIAGPDGEDGLLLEQGAKDRDFLVVEHVQTAIASSSSRGSTSDGQVPPPRTLMRSRTFEYAGREYKPAWVEPSPDLTRVLIGVDRKSVWRHSFTAIYFVLDVATQSAHPLIPSDSAARVQLATWSPASDAVAFTRDNNLYVRRLTGAGDVVQVSRDGGPEYFYGIPDWVYEEEVFSSRTATWWSADGKYLAFLRTNETAVPEYTLQYFVSRPSGAAPPPGHELYPEQRKIKYPKAGAPNPVVDLLFYDVAKGGDPFAVPVDDAFPDDDRIINSVVWAGDGKVLVKQTNRVSDILKVLLVDVGASRTGKTVHALDVGQLDGGWFEISHQMTFVPADPANGRPHDGYVDTVIHDGYDHLAYFSPLDGGAPPTMLTSGPWEVVQAPSAVDLARNLVYFVATRESSLQRHVYSVRLDGSGLAPLTNTSAEAYYAASFSPHAGYALLDYEGPRIPFQKVVSTAPSSSSSSSSSEPPLVRYDAVVEDNAALADRARKHQLPLKRFGTLALAPNVSANYVERLPPQFDPSRRHPALFFQYSGPGSQQVHKRFLVDFQSYVASALGYVVITLDPRGTGFLGRAHRVPVRSRLGVLEAHDHIAAARHFAALPYIDPARLCIWGWSYGGFQTLKTLETDAGRTFSYGMAVAPVTDWRFYDSIYAERYMRTPDANSDGYDASRVSNASALAMNKRFLIMHGVADDNVHFQNSLTLLDELDLNGVTNYDVHVFPDSDHSIYFHGASRIVHEKLSNWLVNAFNGEWLSVANAKPNTD